MQRRLTLDGCVAGLFAVAAVLAYLPALGVSSLWRDDAWVALVTKADGLDDFRLVAVTAPGFSALLKGWLAVAGFDEWKAQLLPLAFGAAAPALLYPVLVRQGVARFAAASGAVFLLATPQVLVQSTRVKQYTLDQLVVAGVLALTWLLLARVTSRRRWWLFAGAGALGIVLSSPSLVFVATGFGICLLALLRADRPRARVALAPTLLGAAFAVGWWVLVLRPAVSTGLQEYWADNYVRLDDGAGELVGSVARVGGGFVRRVSPLGLAFAPVLFAAFVVALRRNLLVGLTVTAPLAVAFALAVVEAAPFGTGRTDIYLYPALAAAVSFAVDGGARLPRLAPVAFAASLLLGALALARASDRYPIEDVRPLVAHVESNATPADAIVAFPLAAYAYGLYSDLPVDFVEDDAAATGFGLRLDRRRTYVRGEAYPHDLERFERVVRRLPKTGVVWSVVSSPREEIGVLGDTSGAGAPQTVEQYVTELFHQAGYRGVVVLRTDGALLQRWARS